MVRNEKYWANENEKLENTCFMQLRQAFANGSRPKKVNNSSKKSRRMRHGRAQRLISSYAEGGRDVSPQPHEWAFEAYSPYIPQKLFCKYIYIYLYFLLENTTKASALLFPL